MNYKEILFFVAKCLTINHEGHNKRIVEEMLQSNTVDWDEVVKVSTAHFVFPALYCNLKRASFLSYLPKELVEYMKYITELNRERNEEIIAQAKELNTLLLGHNITPIFIKGTGNLLEGLYDDIAERMVGDIDFICSPKDYPKAIQLLEDNGYSSNYKKNKLFTRRHRHFPRLTKKYKIAAVEIHKEFLIEKYNNEFNYDFVKNSIQKINSSFVLNFKNQLILSSAAHQINDYGFDKKSLALRNAYDVFLLSKKTNAKKAFLEFNALKHPLHCFLANCYEIFNKPKTLQHFSSNKIVRYLNIFYKYANDRELAENNIKKIIKNNNRRNIIIYRFKLIYKSFFSGKHRSYLIDRVSDKNWRKEKLIQLGIRKA
jgi:hypothetical protein